jgi:hypothetical protein
MTVNANVTQQQITASVSGDDIAVSVSGGIGPSGPAGPAGAGGVTSLQGLTGGLTLAAVGGTWAAAGSTITLTVTGANSVAWADITGKPSFAAVATSGAYSDLTGTPAAYSLPTATASVLGGVKIGSGVTITDGAISVSTNYAAASHTHSASDVTSGTLSIDRIPTGQTSTTVPLGNDARFTDARNPTAHKASHATGGADALTAADIDAAAASHSHAASDITSGTIATARLGTLPNVIFHPFLLMGG